MVDGEADLLLYKNGSFRRYFFRVGDNPVKQLVYKEYLTEIGDIAINDSFKQQLWENLQCGATGINDINAVDYQAKDFVPFFIEFNKCRKSVFNSYYSVPKGKFSFRIKAGAGLSSFALGKTLTGRQLEFDQSIETRIGAEVEYLFPFNKNKWGFFAEGTYRSFKYEKEIKEVFPGDLLIKYSSVELLLGLRHYLFLNEDMKMFLNGGVLIDIPVNENLIILNTGRGMDPQIPEFISETNIALGAGLEILDRISVEVRYLSRKITGAKVVPNTYNLDFQSRYSSVSLVLGYRIF